VLNVEHEKCGRHDHISVAGGTYTVSSLGVGLSCSSCLPFDVSLLSGIARELQQQTDAANADPPFFKDPRSGAIRALSPAPPNGQHYGVRVKVLVV
jgi:hypothetical protein